jgi:peptidoglycan/LPS O-acetylase OafA/YrhL
MDSQIQDRANEPRPAQTRISFESTASRSAKYRADIDGLRAVAVMAVLFFHLGIKGFRSGFVGVDIFYVISGYLITSLIAKDLADGRFSIVTFYERRMRRIFPALFTVLFSCSLVASVLLYPRELARFGKSLFTTTFFVSNFYFWHSAEPLGYFDTTNPPPPLLHTWSLAVEEQFYLLFPLTLYLLFRWARGKLNAWLFFFCVLSFGLNIWATEHKPIVAFYWLMPRAWELLIGALLAMKAVPLIRNQTMREAVALLGIGMILASISLPIKGVPFPGYFVLLPCVGTWLVIYSGEVGPSLVSKTLSLRPIVFVGVISYSLYLWHWPAIVFSRHLPFHFSRNLEIAFVLLFSIFIAFVSFEYIERTFRGSASRFTRRQIFAFGFAASLLTAFFGVTAYRSGGLPQRYDWRTRQLVLTNQDRMLDFNGSCGNWKTQIRSISDIKFCNLGDQAQHKIMFWGDSHLEQLFPAMEHLYKRGELEGRGVVLASESGCFPDKHLNTVGGGFHCDTFATFAEMRAQSPDVDLVFLGFSTWLARWDNTTCVSLNGECLTMLSKNALRQHLVADLTDEIRVLKRSGKEVIVCLPFPIFNEKIPEAQINNAVFGRFGLLETPTDVTSPSLREAIREAAIGAGAEIFDPRETLCRDGNCITEVDGVSIYKDESHLALSQVNILESSLRNVIQRSLVGPVSQASIPAPQR